MATVRGNRLDYPLDHPHAIRDGFFIQGYDFGAYESLDVNQEHYERARASLSEFARKNGIVCIPVQTNLRHLDDDDEFFYYDCFGAALAAISHLFSRRITFARLPSSASVWGLVPEGSHPLLDPNYSSAGLDIIHDSYRLTRYEKVRLVAGWDEALNHLRACFDAFRKDINCGKCEKCLRTMTALLIEGKLKDCSTYPLDDLAPEHLRILNASEVRTVPKDREQVLRLMYSRISSASVDYWRQLQQPLRDMGREDLADVVKDKITEFDTHGDQPPAKGWRGFVKRLDRKYLNGLVIALYHRIRRR